MTCLAPLVVESYCYTKGGVQFSRGQRQLVGEVLKSRLCRVRPRMAPYLSIPHVKLSIGLMQHEGEIQLQLARTTADFWAIEICRNGFICASTVFYRSTNLTFAVAKIRFIDSYRHFSSKKTHFVDSKCPFYRSTSTFYTCSVACW